jgi:hypothetical protein
MFRCIAFALLPFAITASSCDAAEPASVDVAGCWSGYWISCSDGHSGPMQATICKIGDNCYEARFKGRFWVVVPFRYSMTFQVVGGDGDKIILAGERRLGPALGSYSFTATVTATDFDASYTARRDNGKFVMQRVGP